MIQEWQRDGYTISTDPKRLDLRVIHGYLSTAAYWATGIPIETVRTRLKRALAQVHRALMRREL